MVDPSDLNVGPAVTVTDEHVRDDNYVLNEIKRTQSPTFLSILENRNLIHRHLFEGVDAGNSVEVIVDNPSDSGVELRVLNREISAGGEFTGQIALNATIDSLGTELERLTTNISDPADNSSSIRIAHGGTYSGGTGALPVALPASGGGMVSGTAGTAQFIVHQGANVHYTLTSETNGNDILVDFVTTEVDP